MDSKLIDKYNVSVPRYTSYPPVPQWNHQINDTNWMASVKQSIQKSPEVSLYIHLPFCENLCTYCACNKRITKNHKREAPYIDNILQEWSYYIQHIDQPLVLREIHLGGGTPTFFDHKELARLMDGLFQNPIIPQQHSYSFEAHPNSTTIDHLRTLRSYGFNRISIGVQDISQHVMSVINRYQSVEQITDITNASRRLGYTSINYDLIYGLPLQQESEIRATMNYVAQMKPDRIAYYSYAHVPWKSKGQRAYSAKDLLVGADKQRLKNIGQQMLLNQGYRTIAMDHFALESDSLYAAYMDQKLHRNFMGYTTQDTDCLIGLGVSAISQTKNMFVQNEKSLEQYTDKIDQGLALTGGHQISVAESIMQQHILNLMCQHKTKFDYSAITCRLYEDALIKLLELENDGLIKLSNREISVTEQGQSFVRNICASIDPMLHSRKAPKKEYSQAI